MFSCYYRNPLLGAIYEKGLTLHYYSVFAIFCIFYSQLLIVNSIKKKKNPYRHLLNYLIKNLGQFTKK